MNGSIELTFDKGHIITIGERLYSQSIELVRELVNNAYGADATRVNTTLADDTIEVRDNSSGMNDDSPVFNRERWEMTESWCLPLETLVPDPERGDGTTVILSNLTRVFELEDVEDCIASGVPLKAPHFSVTLNGYPVRPRSWSGQKVPVVEGTSFGPVWGEVVILCERPHVWREVLRPRSRSGKAYRNS